jgi:predicted ferric reductase
VTIITLSLCSFAYFLQRAIWIVQLAYRNKSLFASNTAWIDTSKSIPKIVVTLQRPWRYEPGQFVYITIPNRTNYFASRLQSHPFSIARHNSNQIELLIQPRRGFTSKFHRDEIVNVLVDGPYGNIKNLYDYDTIVFLAEGLGISPFIASVANLLKKGPELSKNRTRRMSIYWKCQTRGM